MTTTPKTTVVPEGNRWQARYYDTTMRLWFDLGDPRDTREEAAELARTWPWPDPRETTLTRTQRACLAWMRAHPDRGQWPLGRGRFANYSADSQWSERTLQGLVDAGLAEWRGSTHETPIRHGVMPHVQLTRTA